VQTGGGDHTPVCPAPQTCSSRRPTAWANAWTC